MLLTEVQEPGEIRLIIREIAPQARLQRQPVTTLTLGHLHPLPHKLLLTRTKPLRLIRKIRNHKKGPQPNPDGRHALQDENPLPARLALGAVHEVDAGGQEGPKGAGERDGVEEDGVAAQGLLGAVPHGEEVGAAGEDASLGEAEEEADGEEAGVVFDEAVAQEDDAEGDEAAGDCGGGFLLVGAWRQGSDGFSTHARRGA